MAQTNVNIRMDEDLKKQFDKFCNDVGMTMTTAICIFAKTVVRQQKIPFEITADPFYSQENMAELERRVANINSGVSKFSEHELIEVDDQ
jgi:DNA-damage-inducible protein J